MDLATVRHLLSLKSAWYEQSALFCLSLCVCVRTHGFWGLRHLIYTRGSRNSPTPRHPVAIGNCKWF